MNSIRPRVWRQALSLLYLCFWLAGCANLNKPVELSAPAAPADKHRFALSSDEEVLGQLAALEVVEGDTLPDIARHYGLGFQQILDANPGMDEWLPTPGRRVILPLRVVLPETPRRGVVANLAAMRLFYFPSDRPAWEVETYPVGIGREGWSTPTGDLKIINKEAFPTWNAPASVREEHAKKGDPLPASVPAGPDNPLGDYAFYLNKPSYLMHGTNKPSGVGMRASHGCLRLYPEDIAALFRDVALKTPLRIVNQPYLLGRAQGTLYLEAHRPFEELDEKKLRALLRKRLLRLEKAGTAIDWNRVESVLNSATGIPVPINPGSPDFATTTAQASLLRHPDRFDGAPEPAKAIGAADWSVRALNGADEITAKRLAAMLNHQGPRIPAQANMAQERYQVVAGPFASEPEARKAARRLQIEFELKSEVIPPAKVAAIPASTARKRKSSH
jgi:L,D-transpeptidase ErfK/SrfK